MNVISHSLIRTGLVALLLFGGAVRFAVAQTTERPSVMVERVEVGIGGALKIGSWTPINVTVTTAGPVRLQLSVEADDPDEHPVTFPSPWVECPTAGTHRLSGLFRSGRTDAEISFTVKDISGVVIDRHLRFGAGPGPNRRPPLEQAAILVATLGHPAGLDNLPQDSWSIVHLESPDELPVDALGYDALNALLIADGYELGDRRSQAVREWVKWGGHLVLAVGSEVEEFRGSSLAEWVSNRTAGHSPPPVPVTGQLTLRELSGLESFVGGGRPVGPFRRIPAARLGEVHGDVMVSGLDGPLLVRVPYGFGRITFLALDLIRPPLSTWEPVAELTRKLITPKDRPEPSEKSTQPGRLAHSGITDLASQLHAAQDYFPQVRRLSTWMVMGLLLVYLALIGPADYFVVHRLLKKPHLTWVTFPAMVIVAAGVTAWGASVANGDRLRFNQLDVIDIDEQTGLMRFHSWITLYSPQTGRYRVELEPLIPQSNAVGSAVSTGEDPRLTWAGIPEETLGGMYRSGGFRIGRSGYHLGDRPSVIRDLPLAIWSTKSLLGCWGQRGEGFMESSLQSTGTGRLEGTFTHRLPVPIHDWMLAYENRVYRPSMRRGSLQDGRWRPNDPISPQDPTIQGRELKGFLTGMRRRRVENAEETGSRIQVQQMPYDPLNRDAMDILRMITFHTAAGGSDYTGLHNHLLRTHDLSNLVRSGRAVLLGRVHLPAARLRINGEAVEPERHTAIVRLVLPVGDRSAVLKVLPQPGD